jgi:hypothetical protein
MSNVIQLPGAAAAPIINPKKRGRPKGTISFTSHRRKRDIDKSSNSPYHPSVPFPRVRQPGRFHYPKELLLQKYICRNNSGWHAPTLSASVVSGAHADIEAELNLKGFISPLTQLLEQLRDEGHDIEAARLEVEAMRQSLRAINDIAMRLTCFRTDVLSKVHWNIDFGADKGEPDPAA